MIDASNDVSRSAKVEHCLKGNKNTADTTYNPGKVVIFLSHYGEKMLKKCINQLYFFE